MDTIIGLGKAGCAIAEKFAQYPQYKIFKIDSENLDKSDKRSHLLKRQNHPEKYEKNTPSLKTFFKGTTDDILFVLSGAGYTSGASLGILQQLSHKNVNILYIKPDVEFLGEINTFQERLVRNVLQEYARSHAISRIYLIDNKRLETILGDVPIIGYYDKLNDLMVSAIHMVNVYNHHTPVHKTSFESKETASVSTIGIVDIDSGEEKLFFPLDTISEKSYYYAINSNTLETDGKLLRRLTESINKNSDKDIRAAFQVHSTSYEQNYGYIVANTSQTNN
jgi:hypothetical protein